MTKMRQKMRKEKQKLLRQQKYAEDAKIAVRNIRRNAMDDLKKMEKDGEMSEDESRQYQDVIQKMTDALIKQIDEALSQKQEEIMQV